MQQSKNDKSKSQRKEFSKQTSPNDGGLNYMQYNINSSQEMSEQKTLPLTSTLRNKNQSNVSF